MYILKLYISEHLLIFTVQSMFWIVKAQLPVSLHGDTNYKHFEMLGQACFGFELVNYD